MKVHIKKIFSLFLCFSVFLSLIACANEGQENITESSSSSAASTEPDKKTDLDGNTLFVPSTYSSEKSAPLLVLLHGCYQYADAFLEDIKMPQTAHNNGFIVVSMEIATCGTYFFAGNREEQNSKKIADTVLKIKSEYNIDSENIWVGGISAGAAWASNMITIYPDIFSGVLICAGLPYFGSYYITTSPISTSSIAEASFEDSVVTGKAQEIVNAMAANKRIFKVMVVHGTNDKTVNPGHGILAELSFAKAFEQIDTGVRAEIKKEFTKEKIDEKYEYSVFDCATLNGEPIVKFVEISGMSHAWPCGTGTLFTDINGPDINQMAYEFFKK